VLYLVLHEIITEAGVPADVMHNVSMCGRYDLNESPQMLARYFLLSAEPAAFSNADVRPTNMAPTYPPRCRHRSGRNPRRDLAHAVAGRSG